MATRSARKYRLLPLGIVGLILACAVAWPLGLTMPGQGEAGGNVCAFVEAPAVLNTALAALELRIADPPRTQTPGMTSVIAARRHGASFASAGMNAPPAPTRHFIVLACELRL